MSSKKRPGDNVIYLKDYIPVKGYILYTLPSGKKFTVPSMFERSVDAKFDEVLLNYAKRCEEIKQEILEEERLNLQRELRLKEEGKL